MIHVRRVVLFGALVFAGSLFFMSPREALAVSCPNLPRNLSSGMSGDDVHDLQVYLKASGFFPSDQDVTNFYGPLTYTAVGNFQEAHTIVARFSAGYGRVGPRTRAQIQVLCAAPFDIQPTTTSDQNIRVTYPNGGENWSRDHYKVIRWHMDGSTTTVRIFLVDTSNGFHWIVKDTKSKPGENAYVWKIDNNWKFLAANPVRDPEYNSGFGHKLFPGATLPAQSSGVGPEQNPGLGHHFKIKICIGEDNKCDSSDNVFSIDHPSTHLQIFVTDPAGIIISYDPILAELDDTMRVGVLMVGENVQMNFHNEKRDEDIKGVFDFDTLPYGTYRITANAKYFMPHDEEIKIDGNHCFVMMRLSPSMTIPFQPPNEPPRPPAGVCADIPGLPDQTIPDELLPPLPPPPDLSGITPAIKVTRPNSPQTWHIDNRRVLSWDVIPSVSVDPATLLPVNNSYHVEMVGYASSSPHVYPLGSTTDTSMTWKVGTCPGACGSVPPGKYRLHVRDDLGREDFSDSPVRIVAADAPATGASAASFAISFGPSGSKQTDVHAIFDPDGPGPEAPVDASKSVTWSIYNTSIAGVQMVLGVPTLIAFKPGDTRAIVAYGGKAKFFDLSVGGTTDAPVISSITVRAGP